MLKKSLLKHKSIHILNNYDVILFFQYNNVSAKKWRCLRNKLNNLSGVSTLVVQNRTTQKILKQISYGKNNNLNTQCLNYDQTLFGQQTLLNPIALSYSGHTVCDRLSLNSNFIRPSILKDNFINPFLQGPTILLGCNSLDKVVTIKNILNNYSNFLFVGGLYNNQPISHYTLKKIETLNNTTIRDLIQYLEEKQRDIFVTKNYLNYSLVQTLFIRTTMHR